MSHISLPTKGVLGEAVLGHCSSAEKIDLTRFWNWQDSPADEATEITGVTLRPSGVGALTAPNALGGIAPIIQNVTAGEAPANLGALAQALGAGGAAAQDFSTAFLGQDVLKELGGKTIQSAESARADALGKATQLASEAMKSATDVFKTTHAAQTAKAEEEKKKAEEKKKGEAEAAKAKTAKQDAAVKDLKDNAKAYLAATAEKSGGDADKAKEFAQTILDLSRGGPLPATHAAKLFAAFDEKDASDDRTVAGTAWLTVLGLI